MAPIIVKGMLGLYSLMDCEVIKTYTRLDVPLVIFIIIKIIKHVITEHISHIIKTKDATGMQKICKMLSNKTINTFAAHSTTLI